MISSRKKVLGLQDRMWLHLMRWPFMLMMLLAFTVFAEAAAIPALTGRIVDEAGIIDPQTKATITDKLAAFEAKSSEQVVIVTVSTLGGEDIETYSNRLFRSWVLGQKQKNNGILLVVAPNDRKIRIEVGYGLEGTMTDALSSIIIQNMIIPAFRQSDYSGGVSKGIDGILTVLSGSGAELEAYARHNLQKRPTHVNWITMIFMTLWFLVIFGRFGFAMLVPILGRRLGSGRYEGFGRQINTNVYNWRDSNGDWGGGGFSGGGGSSGGGGASGSW